MSILVVAVLERRDAKVRDGGRLRVTRKPFLAEMTEEEKEADRERRANRPPRSDDDRGGRGGDRGRGRR